MPPSSGSGDSLDELLRKAIFDADPSIADRIAHDPDAYLDLLELVARARANTIDLLDSTVEAARGAGHSWTRIGERLGLTRQAAQQRFASTDAEHPGQARTKRLTPLTAFDEMDALNREGEFGWHSIGFGTLYHLVEKSDRQWEHLRVLATSPHRRQLEADGWERVGTMWFPWAYYARATDRAALPELAR
jgi:hypothetical protein